LYRAEHRSQRTSPTAAAAPDAVARLRRIEPEELARIDVNPRPLLVSRCAAGNRLHVLGRDDHDPGDARAVDRDAGASVRVVRVRTVAFGRFVGRFGGLIASVLIASVLIVFAVVVCFAVFFAAIGLDVIFVPFYGLVDGFYRVGSHCRGRGPSRNDGRTAEDDVVGPDHDGACFGRPVSRDCGVAVGRIRLVDAGGADHPIDAVFEVSVDGGRGTTGSSLMSAYSSVAASSRPRSRRNDRHEYRPTDTGRSETEDRTAADRTPGDRTPAIPVSSDETGERSASSVVISASTIRPLKKVSCKTPQLIIGLSRPVMRFATI